MFGKLILEDGTIYKGRSFGDSKSTAGEVVFSTGMVGYPESLTDPSYLGQIVVMTYPIIGNYGVPDSNHWESQNIKISGLIVSTYNDTPSHWQSKSTLASWLKREHIPLLEIADTRALTQKIRSKGVMLGKIVISEDIALYDPDKENLVAKASTSEVITLSNVKKPTKKILLIDCGAKKTITTCLLNRGVQVTIIPWDFDPFKSSADLDFDAIVISNGPGNPKMATKTIEITKKALEKNIPILGICLGNQILALAAGGDTKKLPFGHRSQNQPCLQVGTKHCYITTQNHGFAVSKIPPGFAPWFINANDGTNEGIIHKTKPIMSVQFHPEATPGPTDTEWIFDYFLKKL